MTHFIDFTLIDSEEELYQKLSGELNFPEYFGNNLDALWDVLTGDIELPTKIHFIDISSEKTERFQEIISVFEDAANELGSDFEFTVHEAKNKKNEDEDAVG